MLCCWVFNVLNYNWRLAQLISLFVAGAMVEFMKSSIKKTTLFAVRVIQFAVRLNRYFGWLLRDAQMVSVFILHEWIALNGNQLFMCIIAVLSIIRKWWHCKWREGVSFFHMLKLIWWLTHFIFRNALKNFKFNNQPFSYQLFGSYHSVVPIVQKSNFFTTLVNRVHTVQKNVENKINKI